MAPFSKPETVLKQAEGLVSVGQTHAALQSLSEMFTSKKFRATPLTSLEPIMLRFIELCVEMRKGRTAKEGLMQYKNIAQNTSVQSIETVINRFIQLSDAKVRDAQEKAAVKVAVDVDDLEASETPESILLGAVSGDQSKDRTDRALVTPWLKFLWESYRTSLETLKNNARLEVIYQQVAQQAFKFCLKNQRKVEFRRLCETLRLHLANVAKYSHQPHSINLSDPDTLQHHLDTRFAQLNTSVELELWQEAFRSVEDVHNLLTLAKKAPRPAMMANYYEKLTKIFLMSGNALYHAAAWGRYHAIVSSIGGKSDEEMRRLAGQVLVSTLAVPVGLQVEEAGENRGKNTRLSSLLGLTKTPTRSGLLKDALSRDVLKLSPDFVTELYNILEVTFDPLTLCSSVAPILQTLSKNESYASYLPLLQRALLSRLLSQISQVYSTINVSSLLALVAPLKEAEIEGAYDEEQVEAYVMGCARRGELNISVDHKEGSITFIDDAFVVGQESASGSSGWAYDDAVQPTTGELVRSRLCNVAVCLHTSLATVEPPPPKLTVEEQGEKLKSLVSAVEKERKALQIRRALVARRRELLSELSVRKEKEESSRRAEQTRRDKEEEERRMRDELRRKELERSKREIEMIRADEAKKYAQTLVEKGILKANEVEKMESFDTEGLIGIQVAQLEKEKKELNERLRIIAKRVDHIERAYRKEERPLLAQDYEQQQVNDQETFEATQKARKENSRLAHQADLETKARLARMVNDFQVRKDALIRKKGEAFAKKKDAAQKKITEEKEKRQKAILQEREEERKRQQEKEQLRREEEEEERRIEEEKAAEEARLREEEERAREEEERVQREKEEAAAAQRKKREEERAEAFRMAQLQRQREEEAEERRKVKQQQPPPAKATFGAARGGTNGEPTAGWRARAAAATAGTATPPRSESPAPGTASVPKYRPVAATGGGWRAREDAKRAETTTTRPAAGTSRPTSPAPATKEKEEPAKEEDGFTTVQPKAVWRPRRGGRP
ncbi:hypothetical protein BDN72DRAFT_888419 [Pluteus cervinus]|uniref:Uncharacterized protein n=1 Tax=Pluteus cervinus TaxID=181527 RepID=A0ACD3ATJ9_9AGAR|nr:hypothetical protein BDN72DRAFT_888419 [Pluteus cervinus]